jgi:hypothetical protein
MDMTYHLIARILLRFYDDELMGISPHYFLTTDWSNEIHDLMESTAESYALDRYEEKGYSLISTPSIVKNIDYDKLMYYIHDVEYDICITKLFDYNDGGDFFDENDVFLKDKYEAMWDAYP